MNIPYVMKKCSKCGRWLVANTVNFYKQTKGKYGLEAQCKECKKRYREVNREKVLERKRQYYKDNRDKILEQQKQYYETNKDKIAESKKQYYETNKDKIAEQQKQYYENNKEKIAEQQKQYREANIEKITESNKRYYEANKDKRAEYDKQYRQSPQGQVVYFNSRQRRRIKEEQQGTGITKDQWLEMMKYFDWRCAYSGEYLGGNDNSFNRTIDHIVPLNSGGDNMIWNCVPMLRSLNSSKHDKDMLEWYREQSFYDPDRLAKIYEWQEYAYNKYGKDTDYFNTNDIQIKLI